MNTRVRTHMTMLSTTHVYSMQTFSQVHIRQWDNITTLLITRECMYTYALYFVDTCTHVRTYIPVHLFGINQATHSAEHNRPHSYGTSNCMR